MGLPLPFVCSTRLLPSIVWVQTQPCDWGNHLTIKLHDKTFGNALGQRFYGCDVDIVSPCRVRSCGSIRHKSLRLLNQVQKGTIQYYFFKATASGKCSYDCPHYKSLQILTKSSPNLSFSLISNVSLNYLTTVNRQSLHFVKT